VEPSSICLEFSEFVFVRDREGSRQTMVALQNHGFQLGLDDFGIGSSCLEHLRDFPFSYFKVDRSMLASERSKPLLQCFAQMGQGLALLAVAEGIENAANLELARASGYTRGQGFYWSAPQPLEQFVASLREGAPA
jgi:EAL domain-containing protein (putative c-di-GMP-specific phosphodiesterase class I)